jgi:hypothetical protein
MTTIRRRPTNDKISTTITRWLRRERWLRQVQWACIAIAAVCAVILIAI